MEEALDMLLLFAKLQFSKNFSHGNLANLETSLLFKYLCLYV